MKTKLAHPGLYGAITLGVGLVGRSLRLTSHFRSGGSSVLTRRQKGQEQIGPWNSGSGSRRSR